ncbi:MAG TPA: cysteine desulfurase NifS [Synergistales bacterium]|jgi:cysteine desulfurase|nr:cysteine desulfurase NifS [Synergistales bacterium]MDI9393428.1 cysteine desulfurase NifS [Synergistota bacterium]MDY0178765.1 cysteine desulfurase NifS [Synergistaceae bacterium]HRW87265.1 cysteine desulfurase NifS [Thermovirgaceae bacterium]MDD3134108.1 cysteine desulfurase NifS [Synergistales bacterium]
MTERYVYMDHSATTAVDRSVLEAMLPYFSEEFGNPNSLHIWGRKARKAVNEAREKVAALVGADASEIIFTGGGSEADNLAIKGAAFARRDKGRHVITTAIEHHAVIDAFHWLEDQGFEVTVLPVDERAMVGISDLESAIRPDTILVSMMYANNEVGTFQPVAEAARICNDRGIIFHVDGVQAAGHIPFNVRDMGIDMLTMSAHKMYGPKGVGGLYIRKGVKIQPIVHGGGQERGLRSGTENTAGIVGFGAAADLASMRFTDGSIEEEVRLRDLLIDSVTSSIEDAYLTGHRTERLPFHASFCIGSLEGESMLLRLDAAGIGASSGSACTSGSLEPSYVLLAMGITHELAHGSLRFSLGKDTTREDIVYVAENLKKIVADLRALSPLWKNRG